ncbi:MAG: hypothetical protein LBJ00_03930 [Planctomycetaceae bacterium]|nr:hypothetical protein [Planctomycetaceae bacterium]
MKCFELPATKISVIVACLLLVYSSCFKAGTQARQREAVVQGRSLLPYRLRYKAGFYVLKQLQFTFCTVNIT